jgi:hypothetical protein
MMCLTQKTLLRTIWTVLAAVSTIGMLWVTDAAAADKGKFSLIFDRLPAQQLAMIYYDQCEQRGIVFDPAVNKLDDVLTMKTPSLTCAEARVVVRDALTRAGVGIEVHDGYDVLRPVSVPDDRDGWREFIYRPRFRDAIELAEQAMIAVRKGSFAHQRRAAPVQVANAPAGGPLVPENGGNGASITQKPIDKLVFYGPEAEAKAVQSLLVRLDVPSPQVEIKAGIYEYQSGKSEGSAVNAALSLFKGKFGMSVSGGAPAGNTIKLNLPSVDAALSLLDQDSRFRYVARPKVMATDSEPVRFFAGEEVRVAGAVILDRNGNPIQSRETLSAGVTLEATPRIRGDVVDLSLYEAVSNFAATSGGDPSVLKRDLRSRLLMQPGYVYVIGGLQTSRKSDSGSRLFGFSTGQQRDENQTEVLLLLSVQPDETN